MQQNSKVFIDLEAYRGNILKVRELAPGVSLLSVVKADAYGHGAVECARTALEAGARWLGVAFGWEGEELRKAGITAPILSMAPETFDSLPVLIENDITITLTSFEMLDALVRELKSLGKTCSVHVKVDTGMGRVGVSPEMADSLVEKANMTAGIEVGGIYSHFHSADSDDEDHSKEQMGRFSSLLENLESKGMRPPIAHFCNSAATLKYSAAHYDLVRAGIFSYGLRPAPDKANGLGLEPVLSWETRVSFLRDVPAGFGVSYGRTFVTSRPSRLATVPVGYSFGYPRALSNRGRAIVNRKYVPVAGAVCMDQTVFDVTDAGDVKLGDKVTLIGRQADAEVTADELALLTETISYEITTGISGRIPRTFGKTS